MTSSKELLFVGPTCDWPARFSSKQSSSARECDAVVRGKKCTNSDLDAAFSAAVQLA
jgi:hypothetical protein